MLKWHVRTVVNYIALCIHYVIVLQQVLTHAEVVFLHFPLCALYRLGDHAVLQHFAVLMTHFVHQSRYTLRPEQTHQVIFQRHEEL